MTYIRTIDELKQYVGKVVVCYYYKDFWKEDNTEAFDPDNENREIAFMWMFKLARITCAPTQSVRRSMLKCIIPVQLCNMGCQELKIMYPNLKPQETTIASSQQYVRIPTKKEMNIYRNITRKKRILGHD